MVEFDNFDRDEVAKIITDAMMEWRRTPKMDPTGTGPGRLAIERLVNAGYVVQKVSTE